MKILCVDDSLLIRQIVTKAAAVLDLEVCEAEDGKQALEILKQDAEDISVITLDWHMPEMDGFEFLTIVKERSDYRDIPVLMVTSESNKKNIVKAVKAGVDNYLMKPFSQEDLLVKIKQCIGGADSRST